MKKQSTQHVDSQDSVKIAQLTAELDAVKHSEGEWKGKYLRALADYQNGERRNREEKETVRMYANEVLLGRMLSALDTLRKAKEHIQDVGLDLAYKEFIAILEEYGVERIDATGNQFDPHTMECIDVADGEENVVIEELLPGYLLNGKVLRVAQVKVGKKNI